MNIISALQTERKKLLAEVARINEAIKALGAKPSAGRNTRPPLSAAARAKIAAAQRARWAKVRAAAQK